MEETRIIPVKSQELSFLDLAFILNCSYAKARDRALTWGVTKIVGAGKVSLDFAALKAKLLEAKVGELYFEVEPWLLPRIRHDDFLTSVRALKDLLKQGPILQARLADPDELNRALSYGTYRTRVVAGCSRYVFADFQDPTTWAPHAEVVLQETASLLGGAIAKMKAGKEREQMKGYWSTLSVFIVEAVVEKRLATLRAQKNDPMMPGDYVRNATKWKREVSGFLPRFKSLKVELPVDLSLLVMWVDRFNPLAR